MGHTPRDGAAKQLTLARKIAYVCIIICCVVLGYFLVFRGLRFFRVPSASMMPTIHPNDYIATLKEDRYDRGDIVVLREPREAGDYVVKRIVGIGGDAVAIKGNALVLNGQYASEPYLPGAELTADEMAAYRVPEGHAFVMGDNRNVSEDSRNWKTKSVPVKAVVGKVRFIYLPFSRFGAVQHYPLVNAAGE